jgi:hypothetical protein
MRKRALNMRARKWSWYVIARVLCVHEETIRRAVDEEYDARRIALYAARTMRRRASRPPRPHRESKPRMTRYRDDLRFDAADAVVARRAAIAGDAAFVAAMTAALETPATS